MTDVLEKIADGVDSLPHVASCSLVECLASSCRSGSQFSECRSSLPCAYIDPSDEDLPLLHLCPPRVTFRRAIPYTICVPGRALYPPITVLEHGKQRVWTEPVVES